jgi:pyruvate/2-oxoglutarate dehydrogenase complex dihydrolipoamide dehydrogenase (E3) component
LSTLSTPDLCIIGAGASGLAVAEAAQRFGASVTLVEKAEPGGASHRAGALAMSALSASARYAAAPARSAALGVTLDPPTVSMRKVHDHIAEVLRQAAPQGGAARIAALGIELVRGAGVFTSPRTLQVGDATIEAKKYVIATGASPTLPDIPGLLGVPYFTTETIFDNTRRLEHLAIVGAGPLGLELALSYRRLGSAVTVVDSGKALAQSDPELVEIALRRLRDEGVVLLEDAAILAVQAKGEGLALDLRVGAEPRTLEASHILVAIGRTPNLEGLGLDAAKIRRAPGHGGLQLGSTLRTSNSRVYAVGEAAGHLTHLNVIEADIVLRAALHGKAPAYEPALLPRLTLTDPPIAEIGMTEPMARLRLKGGYSVLRASYAENDLARANRDGMGLVKLVLGKAGRIIGAGIVGTGAGELAAFFALAMADNRDAASLYLLPSPHPTIANLIEVLGAQARGPQKRPTLLNRLLP